MKAAFEILGYPTYHYVSMMENPLDIDFWLELLERKYPYASSSSSTKTSSSSSASTSSCASPNLDAKGISPTLADFDALLGHVSAVTDVPCNVFALDLIHLYPNAKVILVEREIDSWFKSFDLNVISSFSSPLTRLICLLDPGFVGKQGRLGQLLMRGQWQASSFQQWRSNAKSIYEEHNEAVKKAVPEERLLVYKLGSGWEPLCKFLGRDVPKEVEFPRVNETEELKERVFLALMLGLRAAMLRWVKMLVWMIPVLVAVVWYLWRR